MKKIYHLGTCDTCKRIIEELGGLEGFTFQNIKEDNISASELDAIAKKVGSYEALFSRRARKYKAMRLADQELTEKDYRRLVLEEYTFLKRPVIVAGADIFVGNSKKTVEAARAAVGT